MFDYNLRGKCRQMSEEAAKKDPSLRVARGYYYCPEWGKQAHWWCVRDNGEIVDLTKNQFPSLGEGVYEEFDGRCMCSECGTEFQEEDGIVLGNGHYIVCSNKCYGSLIGF